MRFCLVRSSGTSGSVWNRHREGYGEWVGAGAGGGGGGGEPACGLGLGGGGAYWERGVGGGGGGGGDCRGCRNGAGPMSMGGGRPARCYQVVVVVAKPVYP